MSSLILIVTLFNSLRLTLVVCCDIFIQNKILMETKMELKFKNSIEKISLVGVCTALIIVLSQIAIPMPSGVPATLQPFAIALCGFLLGWKLAGVSTFIYIAMGAIGLPVFANFSGGFGTLVGMTGGFIWGFILMALLCGFGNKFGNKAIALLFGIAGLLVCHCCGALQYGMFSGIDFIASFLLVCAPYLVKDIIFVVVAYGIANLVSMALQKSKVFA